MKLKPTSHTSAFIFSGVIAIASSQAATIQISEGFENIATLAGNGWVIDNQSVPVGTTSWFQGNNGVFNAQSGTTASYIGVNFDSTTGTGTISNWLISPTFDLSNPTDLTFWSRTVSSPAYPDRLEVWLSTSGSSTNLADFTFPVLTINPLLTTSGYPDSWAEYSVTLSQTAPSARIGFRYYVTNGGSTGSNSNYIGIDSFAITSVPEPTSALATAALLAGGLFLRRRTNH